MTARTFWLRRDKDETGISGTGLVAEGVLFGDGSCAMRWMTKHRSTAVYASVRDLLEIHGHNGKTRLQYDNPTREGAGCERCLHPADAHWMDNCGGCDVAGCDCSTMTHSPKFSGSLSNGATS